MTRPFITELRTRLGVGSDDQVLKNLRALLLASTSATYHVRAGSFDDDDLKTVDKTQRDQVRCEA